MPDVLSFYCAFIFAPAICLQATIALVSRIVGNRKYMLYVSHFYGMSQIILGKIKNCIYINKLAFVVFDKMTFPKFPKSLLYLGLVAQTPVFGVRDLLMLKLVYLATETI